MKKTVLTSIVAVMMSTIAATAAETSATSNYKVFFGIGAGLHGWNYTGNFDTIVDTLVPALSGRSVYGGVTIDFPEKEVSMGMEGGVRFGKHSDRWNFGFTIAADKTLQKKANIIANEAFKNLSMTDVGVTLNTEGGVYGSRPGEQYALILDGDPTDGRKVTMTDFLASTALNKLKLHTNIISFTFDNYIRLNNSRDHRFDIVLGVGVADIETNMNLLDVGVSISSHAAALKAGMELELTDVVSLTAGSRMYVPVSGQFYSTQYDLKAGIKFSF